MADIRRLACFLVIYTQTVSYKKEFHRNVYKPKPNEYDPYYDKYISLVPETDIRAAFAAQPDELRAAVAPLPEEKGTFAYDEGKWTIKEVLSHLIDGERIFAYRILRISRGDETPLEGFEQDGYIENSNANHRSFSHLLDEFGFCRRANALMLDNLNSDAWARVGTASGSPVSVRALANICIGHVRHHLAILEGRYLV
ncbi:MAG: DinB family protein [Acidobacteria bacterium]|nr:DinB family protein [Acidobacteriota bacterium]